MWLNDWWSSLTSQFFSSSACMQLQCVCIVCGTPCTCPRIARPGRRAARGSTACLFSGAVRGGYEYEYRSPRSLRGIFHFFKLKLWINDGIYEWIAPRHSGIILVTISILKNRSEVEILSPTFIGYGHFLFRNFPWRSHSQCECELTLLTGAAVQFIHTIASSMTMESSNSKTKKAKYFSKYKDNFHAEWDCVTRSKKGEYHALTGHI